MAKRAPQTEKISPVNNIDRSAVHAGATEPIDARALLQTKDGKRTRMPTTLSQVKMDDITEEDRKRLVTEIRREYQRQYYQKHKEKAKEYQRQYNLTHKKKARGGRGKASFTCPRENVRMTFNTADLMHSPVEKTVKMIEKIISGERLFTM